VQLAIGVSTRRAAALAAANQPLPPPLALRAVIGTGASGTVVLGPSCRGLGLQPSGSVNIHTPTTAGISVACFRYDVGLAVLDNRSNFIIGDTAVIETDLTSTGVEALIGCDVLAKCLFIYDGSAQTFTLSF